MWRVTGGMTLWVKGFSSLLLKPSLAYFDSERSQESVRFSTTIACHPGPKVQEPYAKIICMVSRTFVPQVDTGKGVLSAVKPPVGVESL